MNYIKRNWISRLMTFSSLLVTVFLLDTCDKEFKGEREPSVYRPCYRQSFYDERDQDYRRLAPTTGIV